MIHDVMRICVIATGPGTRMFLPHWCSLSPSGVLRCPSLLSRVVLEPYLCSLCCSEMRFHNNHKRFEKRLLLGIFWVLNYGL